MVPPRSSAVLPFSQREEGPPLQHCPNTIHDFTTKQWRSQMVPTTSQKLHGAAVRGRQVLHMLPRQSASSKLRHCLLVLQCTLAAWARHSQACLLSAALVLSWVFLRTTYCHANHTCIAAESSGSTQRCQTQTAIVAPCCAHHNQDHARRGRGPVRHQEESPYLAPTT